MGQIPGSAPAAIVVGHSMGCNVAARFAAEHPDRAAAVVLLDSGLPLRPDDIDFDDAEEDEPHGLLDRLEATFASVESTRRTGATTRRSRAPGTRTSRHSSSATSSKTRTACAAS
jgi:pimeloyl-ACP methyl ester carboxylesterase